MPRITPVLPIVRSRREGFARRHTLFQSRRRSSGSAGKLCRMCEIRAYGAAPCEVSQAGSVRQKSSFQGTFIRAQAQFLAISENRGGTPFALLSLLLPLQSSEVLWNFCAEPA